MTFDPTYVLLCFLEIILYIKQWYYQNWVLTEFSNDEHCKISNKLGLLTLITKDITMIHVDLLPYMDWSRQHNFFRAMPKIPNTNNDNLLKKLNKKYF